VQTSSRCYRQSMCQELFVKSSLHICQTYHLSGILFVQVFTWVPDRQGQANLPENKKNKTNKTNIRNTKKTNQTNPRRRQPRDRAVHKETFRKTKKTKQTKKHKRTTKKTIKPIPGEESHEIVLCSVDVCKNIVFFVFFCFACSNVFLCCFVVFFVFLNDSLSSFGVVDFLFMARTHSCGQCGDEVVVNAHLSHLPPTPGHLRRSRVTT